MDINTPSILHYAAVGTTIVLPILGVSAGQAYTGKTVISAIDRQPEATNTLRTLFMIALALTETAAILSTLLAAFLLLKPSTSLAMSLAQCGAAVAIALPAAFIGFLSGFPIQNALTALSRQPLIASKVTNLLLLTVSMAQTPVIFGFLIGLIIVSSDVSTVADGLRFLGAGLALGLGAIGPAIGCSLFSAEACTGIGINREAYGRILSFTFISQALIETPVLFSLVISFILISTSLPATAGIFHGIICIVTAVAAGLVTLGVGIGSGRTSGTACRVIAQRLEHYSALSRTSLIGQTLIDTNAIYGLIIALFMILTVIR